MKPAIEILDLIKQKIEDGCKFYDLDDEKDYKKIASHFKEGRTIAPKELETINLVYKNLYRYKKHTRIDNYKPRFDSSLYQTNSTQYLGSTKRNITWSGVKL